MLIPKLLHAIWLGNVLDESGRKNLQDWKLNNPDYQVNLWIDSDLLTDTQKKMDLNELKKWATVHGITVCDIAQHTTQNHSRFNLTYDAVLQDKSAIYNDMPGKTYFDDEINGKYKNFGAASDILRLVLLKKFGGIYFDAKDIYPGKPLGEINAPDGFLYHQINPLEISNDILACIPNNTFITSYLQRVLKNYQELYTNEILLKAHRNAEFTSPKIFGGDNSKKNSTIAISGPGALKDSLYAACSDFKKVESFKSNLQFDLVKRRIPQQSALSWYDSNPDLNSFIPILRNFMRVYFDEVMSKHIDKLDKCILNEKDKNFFQHDDNKIQEYSLLRTEFTAMKIRLNTLPSTVSMVEMYNLCINNVDSDYLKKMDLITNGMIKEFSRCSSCIEQFLQSDFNENNINKERLQDHLSYLASGPFGYTLQRLESFIKSVFDLTEPNYQELKNLGIAKTDLKLQTK